MRFPTMGSPSIAAAVIVMACAAAGPASAGPGDAWIDTLPGCSVDASPHSPWAVSFGTMPPAANPLRLPYAAAGGQAAPAPRAVPVEYSEGYKTRAKIHKIASFATLPLFVANYLVGQDLYNNPGDESKKGLHAGLAATTGVLFGVNTFTGAWNLWEGRKDPSHRTRRMTHGILMMAADVGFLATAMLAPESEENEYSATSSYTDQRSTHRTVALTSMGIATVSYLIMLFGGD
jgi:hypothetical protein